MPLLHSDRQVESAGKDKARLGQINFVNCLPIVLPLTSGAIAIDAEMSQDTPANLNAGYESGNLDLGAMSSFFYLSNQDDLELLPGLSISTNAAVGSVLFFNKGKLKDGCRVSVPASSATSVALLKLYLAKIYSINADIVTHIAPDVMDDDIDAALVIGDRALTVDRAWSEDCQRTDLGQWWSTNFEAPMVFGLWAARKDWKVKREAQFEAITKSLVAARDLGLSTLFPEVLIEAEKRTSLDGERLRRYFLEELNFTMSPAHLRGLEQFKASLREYGILS